MLRPVVGFVWLVVRLGIGKWFRLVWLVVRFQRIELVKRLGIGGVYPV